MILYSLGEDWEDEEKKEAAKRVLELSDVQIEELFDKVGISWTSSMEVIIKEIRDKRMESMNLDVLLTESDSKEVLLKLLSQLEEKD